jgi:fructose transport system ATP-binding protein
VDQEGEDVTPTETAKDVAPILEARGLVKRYGHVTALAGADFDLRPGEILAVVGDNGAGKSSLIKCLSGAIVPDEGEILLDGRPVTIKSPLESRALGIETVYQTLAVSPSLDIADNLFLGREPRAPGIRGRVFRKLDRAKMRAEARKQMSDLGIMTIQDISQQVESLSGGQRQGVAVARAAAFGSRVIIMDEPTAALGVKESAHVLELIMRVRDSGLPVILISHNMPHVFEVADRIHIHRLGKRIAVVTPKTHTMNEVVAIMTGAAEPGAVGYEQVVKDAQRADPGHSATALKKTPEG